MGRETERAYLQRAHVKAWFDHMAAAPQRRADTRFAARVLALWDARRRRGAEPLFVPTIDGAIRAELPLLAFHCPGCQVQGEVDLRTLDRHPETPITGLIPSLSCQRCSPNPPFAQLDGLRPSHDAPR